MKDGLGTLLDEAAAGARNYADSGRAVSVARRRRAYQTAGAAMLVIAVLLGGSLTWDRPRSLPPTAPTRTHPIYPPQISPPEAAEVLPERQAVGAASFLYAACLEVSRCPEYLVMPDGRQYLIPPVADRLHSASRYTLSPDGRYLGWDAGERFRIRDLEGGSVRDIDVPGAGREFWAAGWSPNSQYLLVVRSGDDGPRSYVRVKLDGSSAPVSIPHDDTPIATHEQVGGVLDTGDVILANPEGNPLVVRLRVVDAATLQERHRVELDRTALLKDWEVASAQFLLAPCGCEVSFPLWSHNSHWASKGYGVDADVAPVAHAVQTGLLRFDLTAGHSIRRSDNPLPDLDQPKNKEKWKFTSMWAVRADLPEGQVALNWRTDRVEIVLIGPVDGSRNVVTRLPAGAVVLVRSATTATFH